MFPLHSPVCSQYAFWQEGCEEQMWHKASPRCSCMHGSIPVTHHPQATTCHNDQSAGAVTATWHSYSCSLLLVSHKKHPHHSLTPHNKSYYLEINCLLCLTFCCSLTQTKDECMSALYNWKKDGQRCSRLPSICSVRLYLIWTPISIILFR